MFFRPGIAYIVGKSVHLKKCIYWKRVLKEDIWCYKELYQDLVLKWREIVGIVCDGRRWVLEYFSSLGIPAQKCHFHQSQTGRLYLGKKTKNKHPCILELKYIYEHLGRLDYEWLRLLLFDRKERWEEYLWERNIYWRRLHKKPLKAYRSLLRNIKYLEIHEVYFYLEIPTTTNGLDWWVFSWLKSWISIHRGLNDKNLCKLIEYYFFLH